MIHRKFGLVVIVGALIVGLGPTAHAKKERLSNRCFGVRVVGVGSTSDVSLSHRFRRGRRFSVREVEALEFRVRLPARLPGSHLVELKLYTPHGDLYQTLTTTHASEGNETATRGVHQRARRRRRWEYATLRLPVAATTIVRSSLYGRWRVETYLDGSSQACCRSRQFVIEP